MEVEREVDEVEILVEVVVDAIVLTSKTSILLSVDRSSVDTTSSAPPPPPIPALPVAVMSESVAEATWTPSS